MEEELKTASSRTKFTLYDIFEFMAFCGLALFFVTHCIAYRNRPISSTKLFFECLDGLQIVIFFTIVYCIVKLKTKPEFLSLGIPLSVFTIDYLMMVLDNLAKSLGYPSFTGQVIDFNHNTFVGFCIMFVFVFYWVIGSVALFIQFCFFSYKSDRKLVAIRLLALLYIALFLYATFGV